MSNIPQTFEDLKAVLCNLTDLQVAQVAKAQGIPVPQEIEDAVVGSDLISGFSEGSKADPDRVYLTTKGFLLEPGSKVRGKGLYLEVRALRQARAVINAAIVMAEDKGFNTDPAETSRVNGPKFNQDGSLVSQD